MQEQRKMTADCSLAGRVRGFLKAQRVNCYFSAPEICNALGIASSEKRERVATVLSKFRKRGEAIRLADGRRKDPLRPRLNLYRYRLNPQWRRPVHAPKTQMIYKAMRLISFREAFSVADIQRSTGQGQDRIRQLLKLLSVDGYLRQEGYREGDGTSRRQALYRVIDTDRFFIEVMR